MVILNFKTYAEATGEAANKLIEAVANSDMKDKVIVAPSMFDLGGLTKAFTGVQFASQHIDNKNPGSTTGWTTPENLVAHGVTYALYNHSEHRVWSDTIVEDIKAIQAKGIKLIVCCENVEEATKLLEASPFGIAYEPKDLIGSGISVTTRPEAVKGFIDAAKGKTMTFVGAGVSTGEDVAKSLELGAEGVLLASAYVKAEDKDAKLAELVAAFK